LATGEFCGPSHEVKINFTYFNKIGLKNISISVRTNVDFARSGICERRPDRTPEEHDYWKWLCLY